jgi:putative ATPase
MRPEKIDAVVGQDHIIGENTALYKMIQNNHLPSMILYGPPGTGKTSLAFAVAGTMKKDFYALNATSDGKKDVEGVITEARLTRNAIIFIDEIHRFNKSQQDTLLRALEEGVFTLIGATTENPFHSVNNAIRSRCGQIKQLKPLDSAAIMTILKQAIADKKNGLGRFILNYKETHLENIANMTGDARTALNILEDVVYASDQNEQKEIAITEEIIRQCIENKGLTHDKKGDMYYNLLSALQKSIRGSDVQAGLYYLARLLEGGDLISICRRLIVIAYEDIGLANPDLCARVLPAMEAVDRLGLPEGRIPLSVITVELCLSAKSNAAYKGLDKAIHLVKNKKTYDVPSHLKDAHYAGAKVLGHGTEYKYPHQYPNSWVYQEYLPKELLGKTFYQPNDSGEEQRLKKICERLTSLQNKHRSR